VKPAAGIINVPLCLVAATAKLSDKETIEEMETNDTQHWSGPTPQGNSKQHSPLPTDAIHQAIDAVTGDATVPHDFLSDSWVNGLQRSKSIALDLHIGRGFIQGRQQLCQGDCML
jgi:hypothetical protein